MMNIFKYMVDQRQNKVLLLKEFQGKFEALNTKRL